MGRDLGQLHPEFRRRLVAMMEATGTYLVSGYRSSDEQQYLYDLYLSGRGNPANPAGSSNHEAVPWGEALGLAADIGGDKAAAHAVCADYGIHFPIIRTEDWHCQPVEVPYAYWTGMPELGGGEPPEPPAQPWLHAPRKPAEQRHASSQGLALIAEFEGFESMPYFDPVGVETIGYGETRPDIIERYRYTGISQEVAYTLLAQRVEADYAPAVRGLGVPLAQSEFDALTSFTYNLGAAILNNRTSIGKAIRAGDYYATADAFGLYVKADGRTLPGLKRRREAEADLFRSEWGTAAPEPPEEEEDMAAYSEMILAGETNFIPCPPARGAGAIPWGAVFISLSAPAECAGRVIRHRANGDVLGDDEGGDVVVPPGRKLSWEMDEGDDGITFVNNGSVNVTALVEADRQR